MDITHIPYRGTGPAMVDTVGGRLAMMFDTTPTALPHIRDGRVRPLAVSAARRDPALPEVPLYATYRADDASPVLKLFLDTLRELNGNPQPL